MRTGFHGTHRPRLDGGGCVHHRQKPGPGKGKATELGNGASVAGRDLDRIEATIDCLNARFDRFERTFRRWMIFSMVWMTVLTAMFVYVVGSCR